MSRALNRFIGLFEIEWTPLPLAFLGISLAIIGTNYQSGHTWVAWHVFAYFSLAGFAIIAFTLIAANYQDRSNIVGDVVLYLLALLIRSYAGPQPYRAATSA